MLRDILNRLKSTKTVLGITGYILTILVTLGLKVDSQAVVAVVTAGCGILVLLGIMNKDGMNTERWDDK